MRARTFMMFQGEAEAALALHESAFPALVRGHASRWPDGSIRLAEATLAGHGLLYFNSPEPHAFGFTPALSLFIDVTGPQDLDDAVAVLSEGGVVRMAPGPIDGYRRFVWVEDRFGVNWQIALP